MTNVILNSIQDKTIDKIAIEHESSLLNYSPDNIYKLFRERLLIMLESV